MNKAARKLRDENNELELGLSREANDVMTDIVVYIRSANISGLNQEIVRRDIGQMLLEGERRGQSAADIIGEDYKAFCDSVISEVPQLTPLQRALTLISDALLGIIIMLAIWTVFAPLRQLANGGEWYIVTVRTSDLIEAIAIIAAAFFIVGYICKKFIQAEKISFRRRNNRNRRSLFYRVPSDTRCGAAEYAHRHKRSDSCCAAGGVFRD